jgi:hypothetical protein
MADLQSIYVSLRPPLNKLFDIELPVFWNLISKSEQQVTCGRLFYTYFLSGLI